MHISVMDCNVSNFDTVSELLDIFLHPKLLLENFHHSVTFFILRIVNVWQRFGGLFILFGKHFNPTAIFTLCSFSCVCRKALNQ